jgi:hypothetical protein
MDQAMTSAMTSPEQSLPPVRRCTKMQFRAWLARAKPGEQIEYHLGLLTWDRSPASGLTENARRALAKVADAALEAAEDGFVHLLQRRNGAFDFRYIAIKASRRAGATSASARTVVLTAA